MSEWKEDDIVAKAASTRTVQLTTGERVSFAREALEGALEQVQTRFIPMNVEHLAYLPPIGRWNGGEIITAEDGADELVLRGKYLQHLRPVGADPDPWRAIERQDVEPTPPPEAVAIQRVIIERRNFEEVDLDQAKRAAPVPVTEEVRWSELPPLEWVLAIPVVWGLTRFAGSFLDTLGRESAEGLVRWVRDLASKAKDGERDRIVTLRFVLADETVVYGFIPVAATSELDQVVTPALDSAGRVAEIAGAQASAQILGDARQVAFLWSGSEWHLAWIASDDSVRVTNWFLSNTPEQSRFLGRPLLPDEN